VYHYPWNRNKIRMLYVPASTAWVQITFSDGWPWIQIPLPLQAQHPDCYSISIHWSINPATMGLMASFMPVLNGTSQDGYTSRLFLAPRQPSPKHSCMYHALATRGFKLPDNAQKVLLIALQHGSPKLGVYSSSQTKKKNDKT
jgi:hypothetical protein